MGFTLVDLSNAEQKAMAFPQFLLAKISAMISIPGYEYALIKLGEKNMEKKKKVLIVTNTITEEETLQIKDAFNNQMNQPGFIQLNLVYVIPHLPTCYFNIPSMGVLVEKYYDEAKETLQQVGRHLNIAKNDQWLITGKIRTEVLRLAGKLNTSFILAGAKQIQELQHSLFFKNIHQYALIKNINQFKQI